MVGEDLSGVAARAEALERAADLIVFLDADGVIRYANGAASVLGWSHEEIVGRAGFDLLDPDEVERAVKAMTAITGGHPPPSSAPYRIVTGDGGVVECDLAGWLLGPADAPQGVVVHLRPTQDSRVLRSLLHRLLAGGSSVAVLTEMLDLLYHRNHHARVVVVFEDEDGVTRVVGDDLDPLLAGLGHTTDGPWARARKTGEEIMIHAIDELPEDVAHAARDAGLRDCWIIPVGFDDTPVAVITEWTTVDGPPAQLDTYSIELLAGLAELVLRWRRQIRELERAATRDPLTGLPNRRALDEFDAAGPRRDLGVLYIDLDRFKPVNDRLGHAAGDLVLRTVANRLLGAVRPTDIVARLGGDEFGVICPGCSRSELDDLARRVHRLVAEPIAVHGELVTVGSSIGITQGHDSARPLLDRADRALYDAKEQGRDAVCWYD